MIDASRSFDCAIIGGGPAGALLAARLAEWNRKVALIDRGGHRGSVPEETLVPAAAGILKRNGLFSSIRAHGFVDPRAHGVIWGDGELRWREADRDEAGFKVVREVFDRDLRSIATSRGARIFADTRVPGPLPFEGSGAFEIVGPDGAASSILARSIVVATGKHPNANLAPVSLVRQLPRTATVSTLVELEGFPKVFRDAAVIEAVPAGWLWWLPMRDGRACLSLFADPEELKTEGKNELFFESLRNSSGPAAHFAPGEDFDADDPGHPSIYPGFGSIATPRLLDTPSGILLVGDAASTIDPLSSQGIEKALASAEQAAVAVNTILENPGRRGLVLRHHHEWESGVWDGHARQSLGFYLRETRFADRPFWRLRHDVVRVEIERPPELALLPERLRLHPHLEPRPALDRKGRVYVETRGWALPGWRAALARMGRVPLEPIIEHLRPGGRVEEFLERASRDARLHLLSRGQVLQTLTELIRLGMIVEVHEGEGV